MDASLERLARNQTLFREVNERLLKMANGDGEFIPFLCECSRRDCAETISLGLDEYNTVRSDPRAFVIVDGHETPEVEIVVESHSRYVVVRKMNGAAFAIESDPRGESSEA
jgi:hypothetical protein